MDEIVAQMSHGGAELNGISIATVTITLRKNLLMHASHEGPAPILPYPGLVLAKPYQWGTECLSGDVAAGPATSFPQAIGMVTSITKSITPAV